VYKALGKEAQKKHREAKNEIEKLKASVSPNNKNKKKSMRGARSHLVPSRCAALQNPSDEISFSLLPSRCSLGSFFFFSYPFCRCVG